MNQANVKVSFYLKKSEADADGNCPVIMGHRTKRFFQWSGKMGERF